MKNASRLARVMGFAALNPSYGLLAALLAGLVLHAASAQNTGRWSNGAPMPSERTEIAAAEVAGKIYVVGGFGGERELEIYDPAADRWSRGRAFPHAVHHAAAVGLARQALRHRRLCRRLDAERPGRSPTTRRPTRGLRLRPCRRRAARSRRPCMTAASTR